MADSFFGFEANMPEDEAGMAVSKSKLMTAPTDHEIDEHNDETFGDGAVEDDGWEAAHEQASQRFMGFESNQDQIEHSLNRLVVDDEEDEAAGIPIKAAHPPMPRVTNLDELFGPSSPPGPYLVLGEQNIWGSPSGRSGPEQQQKQQQQQEGLQSLLRQLQAKPHPPFQDPSIVMSSKAMSSSLPNAKTLHEIEAGMRQRGEGPPHAALTLDQLEAKLRGGQLPLPNTAHPPPPLPGRATLGELEAAMRSGKVPSVPPPGGMILPPGTPPQTAGLGKQTATIPIPGSMGERRMVPTHSTPPANNATAVGTPPNRTRRVSQSDEPAMMTDSPKSRDFHTPGKQRPPVPVPFSDPTHLSSFSKQHPSHHNSIRQSLFPNPGSRGRGGPQQPRPFKDNSRDNGFDNYNYNRDNRNYRDNYHGNQDYRDNYHNQGGYRNNRGDYRDNWNDYRDNRGDFRDNRGFRGNRGGDYYEGRGDYFDNREDYRDYRDDHRGGGDYYRGRRGNYNQRPRHDSHNYDYDEPEDAEENSSRDPFAGLMTKKEKDWIIKIQLMQLQTDNPYLDDYYYAAWQVKKLAAEQRKKQGLESQTEPKLVIPQLAGRLETRAYKPVQFENSLGRLTAASVHNPRHIIDVALERPADKDENARELRRYKELLLHIEMSYNILLDIDDLEKRALVLPEDARPPLLAERENCIKQLYQRVVHQTHAAKHFSKVVAVRKGVKLVARIIPLLSLNEATDLVCELLRHLASLAKKDWQKDVLPGVSEAISHVINLADLESLVRFADAARQGQSGGVDSALTIATALQNPFGSSVIWCLVNRGEHVYTTHDPLDMDVSHQHAWREFVSVVAEALSVLSKEQVAPAGGAASKQVTRHFERLVDKRTFISIEDKLGHLQITRAS